MPSGRRGGPDGPLRPHPLPTERDPIHDPAPGRVDEVPMSAEILPFVPRFDPMAPGAERRYDGVVSRINRVSALRRRAQRTCAELERQFVENDLVARSGPRRGRPLTPRGRRRRLDALLAAQAERLALDREWERLNAELERMNRALDAWAREHWGMGGGS